MRVPRPPESRRRQGSAATVPPAHAAAPPTPAPVALPATPPASIAEDPQPAKLRAATPPAPPPAPPPKARASRTPRTNPLARLRRARPAEQAAARLRDLASGPAPPDAAAPPVEPGAAPPAQGLGAGIGPAAPILIGLGMLLALVLLDLPLGGRLYAGWAVHPFGLPVLYVAARHGLIAGAGVAAIAAVIRLGFAFATDSFTANAWVEPLAWPLGAMLVGWQADRTRTRAEMAEAAAAAAQADRAAIAESNERLAQRAAELEGRLSARVLAETTLFESARALGHGVEGVVRGATGLVRAATGCTACSFWLAEGRTLHLVAAEGWPGGASLQNTFLRGPLPDAMEQGATLVITRAEDRVALGEEGILAAPVRSPWDGMLLGMVKIEDIGFPNLAFDTLAALEAAAGWLGAALAEARATDAQPAGGSPGILAGEEASRAIAAMIGLARRVGFDLAMLSAEIPAGPRAGAALEAARAAMAEAFRGSDLLLESRLDERRLSVLLPGAAVQGADIAAARLRAQLAERAPAVAPLVVVGVAALHRGGGAPAASGQMARQHG
jgi:hypothetical protein